MRRFYLCLTDRATIVPFAQSPSFVKNSLPDIARPRIYPHPPYLGPWIVPSISARDACLSTVRQQTLQQ